MTENAMQIKSIAALALLGLAAGITHAAESMNPAAMSSMLHGMTPEQRQAMHDRAQTMRQRMEQMTPEQRQTMQARMLEQMQRMQGRNSARPYGVAP